MQWAARHKIIRTGTRWIVCLVLAILAACSKVEDREPFRVAAFQPAAGLTGVAPEARIRVTFNRELDPSSLSPASITVSSNGIAVTGYVETDGDAASLHFVPDRALSFGRRYSVAIDSGIRALDGSALRDDGIGFEFTTRLHPRPIRLSKNTPAPFFNPVIAYDSAGNGMAAWTTEVGSGVYKVLTAYYDAEDTRQWRPEQLLASDAISDVQLVASGERFAVVWVSRTQDIRIASAVWRHSKTGWEVKSPILPSTSAVAASSTPSTAPVSFAVRSLVTVGDGSGGFGLVWASYDLHASQNRYNVFATAMDTDQQDWQKLDALDGEQGSDRPILTGLAGYQGNWLAVWSRHDGSGDAVLGSVLSANPKVKKSVAILARAAVTSVKAAYDGNGFGAVWREKSTTQPVSNMLNARFGVLDGNGNGNGNANGAKVVRWNTEAEPISVTGDGGEGERILGFGAMANGYGVAWEQSYARVAVAYRALDTQRRAVWSTPKVHQATRTLDTGGTMDLPLADAIPLANRFAIVTGMAREWRGGGGGSGGGGRPLPQVSPMIVPDFTPEWFFSPEPANDVWGAPQRLTGAINARELSPVLARNGAGIAAIWTQKKRNNLTESFNDVYVAVSDDQGVISGGDPQSLAQREYHATIAQSRSLVANAVNANGDQLVAWVQYDNGDAQVFANLRVSGHWQIARQISRPSSKNNDGLTVAALDGRFRVVWLANGVPTMRDWPLNENAELGDFVDLSASIKGTSSDSEPVVRFVGAAKSTENGAVVPITGVDQSDYFSQMLRLDAAGEVTPSTRIALPSQPVGPIYAAANVHASALIGRTESRLFVALFPPNDEEKNQFVDFADAVHVVRYWLTPIDDAFVATWETRGDAGSPGETHLFSALIRRDASGAWMSATAVEMPVRNAMRGGVRIIDGHGYVVAVWREWDSVKSTTSLRYAFCRAGGWSMPDVIPVLVDDPLAAVDDVASGDVQTVELVGDSASFAVLWFDVGSASAGWNAIKYDVASRRWSNAYRLDAGSGNLMGAAMHKTELSVLSSGYDSTETGNELVPRLFVLDGL